MKSGANRSNRYLEPSPEGEEGLRGCDWPGCAGEGAHRAPRARENMESYFWFCLDHIRKYNKDWNYYSGMNEDEVEADVRKDTVWHRPSWPLGAKIYGKDVNNGNAGGETIRDDFGVFGDGGGGNGKSRNEPLGPGASESRAMAILDINPPITPDGVKARYKELVKQHHPDANGGNKDAEEKFKEINRAYQVIMDSITP